MSTEATGVFQAAINTVIELALQLVPIDDLLGHLFQVPIS